MALAEANKLTVDGVKKQIGPYCTDEIAKNIVEKIPQANQKARIGEIKKSLDSIVKDNPNLQQMYITSPLNISRIAELFVKNPDGFVEVSNSIKDNGNIGEVFNLFDNGDIAKLYVTAPKTIVSALIEIHKSVGSSSPAAFAAISDRVAERFVDYCKKKIKFNELRFSIYSSDVFAIDIGRPLDELHENEAKRKEYLNKMSELNVIGALCSNPEYFFTSSNHMLFDRLKKDLGKNKITEMLKEYGAGTEEYRNLIFRSINYGRFYGSKNSIFTQGELSQSLDALFDQIKSDKFDAKYYFLLANGLSEIKNVAVVRQRMIKELEVRLGEQKLVGFDTDKRRIRTALEYLMYEMDHNTGLIPKNRKELLAKLADKGTFNPRYYTNDGKLTVIQVFDKEDTEKDHWGYTQKWFKGRQELTGPGRIVFENGRMKQVLFMGETETDNIEFIRDQLKKTPNAIITFRGHSFSLGKNFPSDIFGNSDSHILFIPGSCGSAGSTASYIMSNPRTDIRFFANTSTGRGQVTNAIIDILAKAKGEERFDKILEENSGAIRRNGGESATIKVNSPGEMLLQYILGEGSKPTQ